MLLTVDETAARLGKSRRQIRYLIKDKHLKARKMGGRWVIDSDDLELSDGQKRAVDRKERQLRAAVEEGLGLDQDSRQRYSIRDLKAFQLALPIYRAASERFGEEHASTAALREVLENLSRGCHRFDWTEKAAAYREARDAASLAACEMVLVEDGDELIRSIEQELMAALAGLLRRLDRKRAR